MLRSRSFLESLFEGVSARQICKEVLRAHLFCFARLEQVEGTAGGDDVGVAQRGGVDERARVVEEVVAHERGYQENG